MVKIKLSFVEPFSTLCSQLPAPMPHAHASDDSTRRRSSASARARPYPLPEATLPFRLSYSPSSSSRRAEPSGAPSTSRRPPLAFPPRFHSPEPIRLTPKLRSLSTSPTEPLPGRIGPVPRHGCYGHEPSAKPPLPCSAAVAVEIGRASCRERVLRLV